MSTEKTGNKATEARNVKERESELTPEQFEEASGGRGITRDTLTVSSATITSNSA